MKAEETNKLRMAIRTVIERMHQPYLDDIQKAMSDEIAALRTAGLISLGEDKNLADFSLELRVNEVFKIMGFSIQRGRSGMEDYVVVPMERTEPQRPLVIEVKSSRKPNIGRDELRQIDDWVFDLSGEELARKHGLGGGRDTRALMTNGQFVSRKFHPTPHKGVLIFNGPIGIPFNERGASCLNKNDEDFVRKRNLCIIPFGVLVWYLGRFFINANVATEFWTLIHSTAGVLVESKEPVT